MINVRFMTNENAVAADATDARIRPSMSFELIRESCIKGSRAVVMWPCAFGDVAVDARPV